MCACTCKCLRRRERKRNKGVEGEERKKQCGRLRIDDDNSLCSKQLWNEHM